MKKVKLGATYNVFNGEELLEASIRAIRDDVDYINVVWQEYSWMNEKINARMLDCIHELQKKKLIDCVIKFEFDTKDIKHLGRLRCKKTNLGLRDLKKNHCTHFIMLDADEFYRKAEFQKAKKFVIDNNITHSFCSIYDYRISPCYRMEDIRDYSVGFIHKFTIFSWIIGKKRINNTSCKVDLFRTVPYIPLFHRFYYLNMVSMHHMTGVRRDYNNKMRNTISNYSERGRKAIQEYTQLQNNMSKMSEKEILQNGYIKVKDEFKLMKILQE